MCGASFSSGYFFLRPFLCPPPPERSFFLSSLPPPPSSKRGTWSAARYNFIYFSIGAICRFAAIPQGRSGRAGNIPDMRQMRSVYLKSASLLAAISLPVAHTFFQVTLLLLIVSVGRLLSAENCRLICYSKTFSRRLI